VIVRYHISISRWALDFQCPPLRFPSLGRHPGILNIMKIDIVSVFPEYFEVLNLSLLGKAQTKGLVEVTAHNLRDWTHDVHHSVDDTPVGGGAGMVMKPEVWSECLAAASAGYNRKYGKYGKY